MKTLVKNSIRNKQTPTSTSRSSLDKFFRNPLDNFFKNDLFDLWNGNDVETIPSINIKEEKDNYKIEVAAPGLKKDDFKIDVDGNILTISSEKESETKNGNGNGSSDNATRREYNYSFFSRSLTLPEDTDANNIKAKYNDGILNLKIAKRPDAKKNKGQRIKVE